MIVDSLFNSIQQGKKGLNKGLNSGFSKLDKLVYGVQRKWMTVYAGDSGSVQHRHINIKMIYCTF